MNYHEELLRQLHPGWGRGDIRIVDACWCNRKPKKGHTRACQKERKRRGLR